MARTLTQTVATEPTLQMKLQIAQPPQKNRGILNAKLKNRLRLDPSRAPEPSRKKIATIEAQRVMSVFEDTILKSEIVTLLPFIINSIDRFSISLGSELTQLIDHHAVILGSYEDIKLTLDKQMKRNQMAMKKRSPTPSEGDPEGNQMLDEEEEDHAASIISGSSKPQSRQMSRASSRRSEPGQDAPSSRRSSAGSARSNFSMDSQVERTVRNLSMVAQQLNTSCKTILRAFVNNPTALNVIKSEFARRNPVVAELILNMNELKDVLMNKLLTTPEEEKEKMEYLQEISKRERNNAAIIDQLETELKASQDDKDEEIRKKNDVIRGLQADLRQISKFSEDHIRRVNSEAEKQKGSDKKNSEGRKQRLQQEVVQLQTQLGNLVTEHRENEQELRKKKFKIETEVENWIQRYDQDMGERQDEFEEIDADYTRKRNNCMSLRNGSRHWRPSTNRSWRSENRPARNAKLRRESWP